MNIITNPAYSFHPANIFNNTTSNIDSNITSLAEIPLTNTDKGVMFILCSIIIVFGAVAMSKLNNNNF